jgi:hypothetical protein
MSGRSCLVERGPLMAQQTGTVIASLDRLFPLWTQPDRYPRQRRGGLPRGIREGFADPVMMNGIATPVAGPAREEAHNKPLSCRCGRITLLGLHCPIRRMHHHNSLQLESFLAQVEALQLCSMLYAVTDPA